MSRMFDGKIYHAKVYTRVLSPAEIYRLYQEERFLFLPWWQRLWHWARQTWLLLIGKRLL